MTCETCKHYRSFDAVSKDGEPVKIGYCHAIRTFPERGPEHPACRKYAGDPGRVTGAE
ncbi:hypothetical protein [Selenomonas ruminantium]|uniref:hypothetical protein n=1 Tax=Selenomonas ruminantium TaxID=971 RepID=UPI0026E98864|nr:hypothetical protein [Selenomonas ruminantium]